MDFPYKKTACCMNKTFLKKKGGLGWVFLFFIFAPFLGGFTHEEEGVTQGFFERIWVYKCNIYYLVLLTGAKYFLL